MTEAGAGRGRQTTHAALPRALALLAPTLALLALGGLAAGEAVSPPGSPVGAAAALAEARAAAEVGRWAVAAEALARARNLAPDDPELAKEAERLEAVLAGRRAFSPPPPPGSVERALAEAAAARARAEGLANAGRMAEAAGVLAMTEAALRAAPLDDAVTAELGRCQRRRGELEALAVQVAADRAGAANRQALDQARVSAGASGGQERGELAERVERVRQIQARGHYDQALAACRQLSARWPGEPAIEGLYQQLLRQVHDQRRLDREQRTEELRQELALRAEWDLLPTGWDGFPVYPDDWRSRHQAGGGVEERPTVPGWMDTLNALLARPVDLDIEGINASEALVVLARQNHFNLVIDPQIIAGSDRPITLRAQGMTLTNALDWITRLIGAQWSLANESVVVGTVQAAPAAISVYDVASLVAARRDQSGWSPSTGLTGAGNTPGGAINSPIRIGLTPAGEDGGESLRPPTPEEIADQIKAAVSPATWQDPSYGITIRGNQLYVSAPPAVHLLIVEYLRSQERNNGLQVKVDARWLTVFDGFLEEVGVDWTSLTGLALQYAGGIYHQAPAALLSASATHLLPDTAYGLAQAGRSSGLNLPVAYLGEPQLSALLIAAERSRKGRVYAGPSLTTINGVRSSMIMGEQHAIVEGFDVVEGLPQPRVAVVSVGMALEVRPLVSADRKRVTMDMRQIYTDYRSMTETLRLPVTNRPGAVQNPVLVVDEDGDVIDIVYLTEIDVPIDLPNVRVTEMAQTVQFADRSSVILGGMNNALDQVGATRTPLLGEIPFLGRLFGRRGRWSEHERTYLVCSATILSYDELEAKL